MDIDGNKIYELINGLKDDISDLKVNFSKDIAVLQYSQEQIKTDVSQLKIDVAEIKEKNAGKEGEQKKGNYIMDKLFWPIVMLILGIFISTGITNLIIKPSMIGQNQVVQQTIPTPTPNPIIFK